MSDKFFMRLAYNQAVRALLLDEVPIGCVIIHGQHTIVGEGFNTRNTHKNSLAHAEITAIAQACKTIGDWRLENCTLYVTIEPCPMCAGAILQARIPKVVFGAPNPKAGCAGSVLNLLNLANFNHQANVISGVLEEECSAIMQTYFHHLRKITKTRRDT